MTRNVFVGVVGGRLRGFRAEAVIDLMLKQLGPAVYNQAVEDVRAHFQGKLDDLAGEVWVDGGV